MKGRDPAPPPAPGKSSSWSGRLDPAWKSSLTDAAAAFVFSRLVVYAAVLAAPFVLPARIYTDLPPGVRFHTDLPWVLDALVRWDGFHFLSVALQGYHVGPTPWETNTPSLPLYPLLMGLTGGWAGEAGLVAAGLLIANACFFAALVVLHRLTDEDFGREVARRTVLYLAVFPSAMFFSALYSESLFMLVTVAFFLALRQRSWWAAGVLSALAAATRVPGMAFPAVFVWEAARLHGWSLPQVWRSLMPLALPGCAIAVVCTIMWVQVGDPISFITVRELWGTFPGTPVHQFIRIYEMVAQPGARLSLNLVYLLVLVSGFAVAGLRLLRRGPSAYALWFWMAFATALSSPAEPLYSAPRLLLSAFPAFIMFAEAGRFRLFHLGYLTFSITFLLISTVLFVQWYWVS